jgi:hypothetical protein
VHVVADGVGKPRTGPTNRVVHSSNTFGPRLLTWLNECASCLPSWTSLSDAITLATTKVARMMFSNAGEHDSMTVSGRAAYLLEALLDDGRRHRPLGVEVTVEGTLGQKGEFTIECAAISR